jgi:fibronectin-binding autotransporter adhesin
MKLCHQTLKSLFAIGIPCVIGQCNGVAQSWNNPAGGFFQTASNWTPAGTPGPGQLAIFDLGVSYTVNFNSSVTNAGFHTRYGNVTFDIGAGNTYTLTDGNGAADIGSSASLISGTMQFNRSGSVGGYLNLPGHFVVQGATSRVIAVTGFSIGRSAYGTLEVRDGAAFSVSLGEIGPSTLSSGSQLLVTGANTTLNAGVLSIGSQSTFSISSNAVATLTGKLTANGTLQVNSSATLSTDSALIGSNQNNPATAIVAGTWNIANLLDVGDYTATSPQIASLVIPATGRVNVGTSLNIHSPGQVFLNGGRISAASINPSGGYFGFNAGTFRFTGNWLADYDQQQYILGPNSSVTTGRILEVDGSTNLQSTMTLDGGTFRTGSLLGAQQLVLQNGLLNITNGSMSVGSIFQTNSFGSQLTVNSGMSVQISNTMTINGPLYMNGGSLIAPSINNNYEVNFLNAASRLGTSGQTLTNVGRITGSGMVGASLVNNANGRIISDAGQRLVFAGPSNNNNANGTLELSGGTLEFTTTLNNNTGGMISGRGVLRGSSANTSGIGLVNQGVVAFSGGVSDIYGKVTNTATGQIINAGGSTLTLHDDVLHNGAEIRTGFGSRTVFLGAATGAGPFTGTGIVEFQGDLRPGNSPANIHFDGSIEIGASATTHFEIAGRLPGIEYDRLTVAGTTILDGTLQLNLLNGFLPEVNAPFLLIDNIGNGPIVGTFSNLPEGAVFTSEGQQWTISYQGGTGNDLVITAAVPEPTTWTLIGLSLISSGWYGYQRIRSKTNVLDEELPSNP